MTYLQTYMESPVGLLLKFSSVPGEKNIHIGYKYNPSVVLAVLIVHFQTRFVHKRLNTLTIVSLPMRRLISETREPVNLKTGPTVNSSSCFKNFAAIFSFLGGFLGGRGVACNFLSYQYHLRLQMFVHLCLSTIFLISGLCLIMINYRSSCILIHVHRHQLSPNAHKA